MREFNDPTLSLDLPTDRLILLGDDSVCYEINDPTPGLLDIRSIMVRFDIVDDYYADWASSDYPHSFFRFVREIENTNNLLTPEDEAIFAKLYMGLGVSPITMMQGDLHDAEIFRLLAEAAADNGGRTTDRDYAYMEECSFVYWNEQAVGDFDPIV